MEIDYILSTHKDLIFKECKPAIENKDKSHSYELIFTKIK